MAGKRYVTLGGAPLEIEFEWPFHPAQAGLDWRVMRGRATVADGSGLHADVALNMTVTIAEGLESLDVKHTESPAVNAVRKAVDNGELEFVKSGKRQPVWISSRQWSLKRKQFSFSEASDEQAQAYMKRKAFWLGETTITDAADAQYLNRTPHQLLELAGKLAAEGWMSLDGEKAQATEKLKQQAAEFEKDKAAALAKGHGATKVAE